MRILIENAKQTLMAAIPENVILNFLSNSMCYWRPWRDSFNTLCLRDAAGSEESGLKSDRRESGCVMLEFLEGQMVEKKEVIFLTLWMWGVDNGTSRTLEQLVWQVDALNFWPSTSGHLLKSWTKAWLLSIAFLWVNSPSVNKMLSHNYVTVPNWSIDS